MSGIVAVINIDGAPIDRDVLEHMLGRLAYKGPDAQNIWMKDNVGLGHALYRTCNEDIEQPFVLDHVAVTAHVRIDVREDLITLLRSANFDASLTTPDVELLAKAYLVWGEDCLSHLLGDFAFVIWDSQKNRLFAARDHFGTHPLYYAHIKNTLIISSEIAAVRRHPQVSSELNEQAIGDFLVIHNVRWLDKTQTIFTDIAHLPPAHKIVNVDTSVSVQRYWLPPVDEPMLRYQTEDEYVENFLHLFKNSVKDRMRAKRILLPLSGGLDSSSIAAMASTLVHSGEIDAELNALTMVYDRIHPDTEAFYAGLVARRLKLNHHIFASDDYRFKRPLPLSPEPAPALQSGKSDAIVRKTYSLASVGLEGHGGDEVLRGTAMMDILRGMSPAAAADLLRWEWRFLGKRPIGIKAVLNPRSWVKPPIRFNFDYPSWLNPDFERQMGLRERYEEFWNRRPPRNHTLHPQAYHSVLWAEWYLNGELLREQPAPPYISTSPLLDVRIVRWILTLPPLPWFEGKYLLRRSMRGMLPNEILARRKTPLGNIIANLLRLPGTEWIDQWEPLPELSRYVRRDRIPPLAGENALSENPATNLRPLWLNEWLSHYREI